MSCPTLARRRLDYKIKKENIYRLARSLARGNRRVTPDMVQRAKDDLKQSGQMINEHRTECEECARAAA